MCSNERSTNNFKKAVRTVREKIGGFESNRSLDEGISIKMIPDINNKDQLLTLDNEELDYLWFIHV